MTDRPRDENAELLALRDRLRQARAERGQCPPWEELKADLLPGGGQRDGRDARQAHAAICPYCGEHVKEWKESLDYESDRLGAIEKGVATGLMRGAQGLVRSLGRAVPGRGEASPRVERAPAAPAEPVEPREPLMAPPPPPPQRMYTPPAAPPEEAAPRPAGPLTRIVVVEMADGRTPPPNVHLCAQVLDAEVAQVDSIDELAGDPDLPLVCGVILGGVRRPETWPDAVRHARRIVPKRPVILLATYGAEASSGARRALGDALQSEADPAERLLLALDPELR
jgi:hypothetical protein